MANRRRAMAVFAAALGDWSLVTGTGSGYVRSAPSSPSGHAGRRSVGAGTHLRSLVSVSAGQLVNARSFATHG